MGHGFNYQSSGLGFGDVGVHLNCTGRSDKDLRIEQRSSLYPFLPWFL